MASFINDLSDDAILKEMAARIAQYRLNQNKTQAALAQEAGVSKRTITRLEQGQSVQISNLIRVLRALQLIQNIEALIPSPAISPVQQIKMQGKQRKRASSKTNEPNKKEPWLWGDDE